MSWRSIGVMLLLAMAAGAVGFAWLSSEGSVPWATGIIGSDPVPADKSSEPETAPMATAFPVPQPIQPSATQAEALLLIANARHTVEAGKPLGDLGSRLQLTFGQSQAQSLAIIAASTKKPLSNADLLNSFDRIAPELSLPAASTWARLRYEFETLFALRPANAPRSTSAIRIDQIRKLIISGDIASAARLVRTMPGASAAENWLASADRVIVVQRAFDQLSQSVTASRAPLILPNEAGTPSNGDPATSEAIPADDDKTQNGSPAN